MKSHLKSPAVVLTLSIILSLAGPSAAMTAVTPSLGGAASFGILASTFTNTVAGTVINGDLGYTTGPAVAPIVNGVTHMADAAYSAAGTAQNSALSALNAQPCDFNYNSATDLSLLTQPLTPGVYCITGATSVGTGGITLNGAGTYVFRVSGALTTVANSSVAVSGGASACNVFWTPTAATTLGANSTFTGTVIAASGVTIGSSVTWTGRSLAFGGTVTSDLDTISVPACAVATPTPVTTTTPTPLFTPTPITTPTPVPALPNSGAGPDSRLILWSVVVLSGMIISAFSLLLVRREELR